MAIRRMTAAVLAAAGLSAQPLAQPMLDGRDTGEGELAPRAVRRLAEGLEAR